MAFVYYNLNMKIYVVRHGQTTGDVEDRYGGDYDDHLTELGKKQAKELAEKIKDFGIQIIFTSPKIRTKETTKILLEKISVEAKEIQDLRERNNNGILTGMTRKEAKEKYPELVELLKDKENTIERAEEYGTFRNRVIQAFNKISKMPYETVAVVTHGGPIKRIYEDVLGIKEDIEVGDCAWFGVDFDEGKFTLGENDGIMRS